jgi:ribonucleoside-diphosphate reductase beta chain
MQKMKLFKNEDKENRFTIKPVIHHDLWQLYKDACATTWFAEEVNLFDDVEQFKNLSGDEQHFLKLVLAFFAGSDQLVVQNLNTNFLNEVNIQEATTFYAHQTFIECVHAETYANIIEAYITDLDERQHIFQALETIPVVKKKGSFAQKYLNADNASFQERLLAFIIFEGVFFSGSFCAIYFFKKRGLLPGLTQANSYIARDEGLHCKFGCLLYKKLVETLPTSKVYDMFQEAVNIETEFINEALKVDLIGMHKSSMKQYIEFVSDYWLVQLGYEKLFNARNPFDFMNLISMSSKTNFFESRVTDYSLSNTDSNEYGIDEDF